MPKGSPDLTNSRREEIINACEKLYETMSFKDITIKQIGAVTSFTRTSIYNYFQTKEEIFLALMTREYDLWCEDLQALMERNETMDAESFACAIAGSLEKRQKLLKLLSMNHYDMEANSAMEPLVEFKRSYGTACRQMRLCIQKFFPEKNEEEQIAFLYAFFPFLFGIYPYAVVTEKQKASMKRAGVDFRYMTIYEITYQGIKQLLK